jgi:YVTN family beta-propeller protein
VSAEAAGEVVCIDAETGAVSDRIRVGERPRGLRLSRDGRRLFVALAGDAAKGAGAGLAIVDVRKRKLLRQVAAGPSPFDVDVSPDGRTAYLSSTAANQLTIVDVASGQPKKKVAAGAAPEGIAVRADGKVVYVTAHGADEVHAIDAKKMELVRRMDAGPGPRSVLFSPAGDTAFVVDETLTTVTALDSRQHTFKHAIPLAVRSNIKPPPPPPAFQAAVLSPDGKRLYVTGGPGRSVVVVDLARKSMAGAIDGVGAFPRGIGMSADGAKLYTANGPSNDVSVIDVATGKVERRIAVGGAPWGIAVAPPGAR